MPAKPPPMMTTRLRSRRGASATAVASSGRVSANIALMDHLVRPLCHWRLQQALVGNDARNAPATPIRYGTPAHQNAAILQCAGLLGAGTTLSASGLTVIRKTTKHRA